MVHKNVPRATLFFDLTPTFLGGFFASFIPVETGKNILQISYLTVRLGHL